MPLDGLRLEPHRVVHVKRQGWGESCRIRLREREAYVL